MPLEFSLQLIMFSCIVASIKGILFDCQSDSHSKLLLLYLSCSCNFRQQQKQRRVKKGHSIVNRSVNIGDTQLIYSISHGLR